MNIRFLGRVDYLPTYAAMQAFTAERAPETPNQLWICEHSPVFTQGLAGLADHVLSPGGIPVVQTNRGGQVTFHGPGQVMAYPMVNLQRAGYFVKEYVFKLEESVLRTLAHFGITPKTKVKCAIIFPAVKLGSTLPGSTSRPAQGSGKVS